MDGSNTNYPAGAEAVGLLCFSGLSGHSFWYGRLARKSCFSSRGTHSFLSGRRRARNFSVFASVMDPELLALIKDAAKEAVDGMAQMVVASTISAVQAYFELRSR